MMFALSPMDLWYARLRETKRRTTRRLWTARYQCGQKSQEGKLVGGVREGLWTFWHQNGQVATYGRYRHGKKQGDWILWCQDGRTKAVAGYRNGHLQKLQLNPSFPNLSPVPPDRCA